MAGLGLKDEIRVPGEVMLAVRERSRLRRGLVRSSSEEFKFSDNIGAAGEPFEPGPIDGRDLDKKPAWNRLGFETSNDTASGKMSEGLESSPESLPG